jgi:hypothetical protein
VRKKPAPRRELNFFYVLDRRILIARRIEAEIPQKPRSGFEELERKAWFFAAKPQKARHESSKKVNAAAWGNPASGLETNYENSVIYVGEGVKTA